MTSSLAISASLLIASTTSADVLLRCPRRRRGKRCSVCTPPIQWMMMTISAVASSRSAIASLITVRTIRFFRRASLAGAVQTDLRSLARVSNEIGSRSTRRGTVASWLAMRFSTSAMRVSVRFQRASNSPATRRFAGSAASY